MKTPKIIRELLARVRKMDRGWRHEVTPLTFGRGRITWTDGVNVEHFW